MAQSSSTQEEQVDKLSYLERLSYYNSASLVLSQRCENGLASRVPDLISFYPSTMAQLDVQQFNLCLKLPQSLKSTDQIATFILESESLNRQSVAAFLAFDTEISKVTLDALAVKICGLEYCDSFVKGLKLYLPSTGILDFDIDDKDIDNNYEPLSEGEEYASKQHQVQQKRDEIKDKIVHRFFTCYAHAHIMYCQNQLLSLSTSETTISTLVEIGKLILDLSRQLIASVKSPAQILSSFTDHIRVLMQSNNLRPLSLREITDIYNDVSSGRPIAPLDMPENLPSYLFAERPVKCGWLGVGYSIDDPERRRLWGVLMRDALYFFRADTRDYQEESPCSCIPLFNVQVLLGDGEDNLLVELWPIDEALVPVLAMDAVTVESANASSKQLKASHKVACVSNIAYHTCVVLDVCPDSEYSVVQTVLDEWTDALELTGWQTRRQQAHD